MLGSLGLFLTSLYSFVVGWEDSMLILHLPMRPIRCVWVAKVTREEGMAHDIPLLYDMLLSSKGVLLCCRWR